MFPFKLIGVFLSDGHSIDLLFTGKIYSKVSVVFADLPAYLSDSLESIQKRVLAITWPGISCSNALDMAGSVSLSNPQAKTLSASNRE